MKRFFKKGEWKLLWPFYISSLLNVLMILSAFFVIHMKSLEFSLFQIGLLISILSASQILFEIPTGAIADIKGRKFSTIIGYLLTGIAFLITYSVTNFYILCILFLIFGIGNTLISGASEAWVVDLVKPKKDKKLLSNYFAKIQSLSSFAMLFSGFVGAYLVKEFGLKIIWLVTGIQFILMAFIQLFAKENFKKRKVKNYMKETIKQTKVSWKEIIKSNALSKIFLATLFIAIASAFSNDLTWQPLLSGLGLKEFYFGYLFSATFILGMIVPFISQKLTKKAGGVKKFLIICLIMMSLFLLFVGIINTLVFAMILYLLFMSSLDFYYPVEGPFFHSFVPNKLRATIGSFKSLTYALAGAITYPLVGLLADVIGPKYTIAFGGVLLIPAILFYSKLKEK